MDRVFRVDRAIYNDPDVLEAEYRNIFEANWVFLCHEAHICNPGDYFATHIGRQPVFVVRKPDSALACYLNACGHRGATLVTPGASVTRRSSSVRIMASVSTLQASAPRFRLPRRVGANSISICSSSISRRSPESTVIVV
jgi:hypothetical protein